MNETRDLIQIYTAQNFCPCLAYQWTKFEKKIQLTLGTISSKAMGCFVIFISFVVKGEKFEGTALPYPNYPKRCYYTKATDFLKMSI